MQRNPQVSPDDLDALLKEFADTRSLGAAADVERGKSASHYVGGSFLHGDDLIRAEHLELRDAVFATTPIAYLSEICCYAVNDELALAISSAGLRGVATSRPEDFRS